MLFALVMFLASRRALADEPGSYVKPMQTCDGIAIGGPLLLAGVFVGGQGVLYIYGKVDTTFFPAEGYVLLGALGASTLGYLGCGPATHLAHGRVDRAAASLFVRAGLPAAAVALDVALLKATARPGEHFGPSGGEAFAGLVSVLAIAGAFTTAFVIDYGLASYAPRVTPAVTPVAGGATAGLGGTF
jgi:hypothetical protein